MSSYLLASINKEIQMYQKIIENIIVTRHSSLVDVLREMYPELVGCPVVSHATYADVAGRHVYGILPLDLAAVADKVTAVTLMIPADLRGVELSAEQVLQYMTRGETYRVYRAQSPLIEQKFQNLK